MFMFMGNAGQWTWDRSLFAGAANYYSLGRMPYPAELADMLQVELSLDGTGRLLDIGCGPGSLTLLIAPLFKMSVGIDADSDMISSARAQAELAGSNTISWRVMRAEEILPEILGRFRLVTFAQSFHWVDRPRVARLVREVLEPDGACVLVHATTHEGVAGTRSLPHPRPPRAEISDLICQYLGPVRRAGQGILPDGPVFDAVPVMAQAGFTGPTRLTVRGPSVTERNEDEIVASLFSTTYAAPHLFGERIEEFEVDLRSILRKASPTGFFCEERRKIALDVWTV
jgi:SAM-dependent methyltransferase